MADDDMADDDQASVDRPAWQQIALVDARTGEAFTLADYGDKPVFVEPFATWCSNCRRQLGNVQQAYAELGDEAVFVALSVEPNIGNEALVDYADKEGFGYTFAAMPPEMLQELAGSLRPDGVQPAGHAALHHLAGRLDHGLVDRLRSAGSDRRAASLCGLGPERLRDRYLPGSVDFREGLTQLPRSAPAIHHRNIETTASMNEYLQAFLLGNAAILTNVCMLPLYPGLIAFMAGTGTGGKSARWIGVLVLAGVLSLMLVIGWLLYVLQASFGAVLPWLLPAIYIVVAVLGVLMLTGRNPFRRLSMSQAPVLRNPYLSAYAYGLMLAPMTLPCVGPVVLSAFLLGAGSTQALADSLLYFLAFGLGFGWPLIVLPLLAQPFQRQFTSWTTSHYRLLTAVSGALLLAIGVAGFALEVVPNL